MAFVQVVYCKKIVRAKIDENKNIPAIRHSGTQSYPRSNDVDCLMRGPSCGYTIISHEKNSISYIVEQKKEIATYPFSRCPRIGGVGMPPSRAVSQLYNNKL